MSWTAYYQRERHTLSSVSRNLFEHRAVLTRVSELARQDGRPALEIGTGTGGMSAYLAWMDHQVISIDRSLELAVEARRRFVVTAHCLCHDAFCLGFADRAFSVAFSQGFFEHFSDDQARALISEQLRVADRVVISMPSPWYPRLDFGNERLLPIERWRGIFTGFRVTESFYYGLSSRRWRYGLRRRPMHLCLVVAKQAADNAPSM